MISRDGWDLNFPNICLTVDEKPWRKSQPGRLTWPGIEPGPARWEATMLTLGHSGGPDVLNIKLNHSIFEFTIRWHDCHKFLCTNWANFQNKHSGKIFRKCALYSIILFILEQPQSSKILLRFFYRFRSYITPTCRKQREATAPTLSLVQLQLGSWVCGGRSSFVRTAA